MTDQAPRPEQEGFGEASLGEAQSENPPSDPEMIDESERQGESDAEESGGDQDAGPAFDPEQAEADEQRDQAEGEPNQTDE